MSRPPLNGKRLSTAELVTTLVERSAPDPHRPRCAPDREERLAHIEQESAVCYAQSEMLAIRMRHLAQDIDNWDDENAESDENAACGLPCGDGIPEEYDGDDDSVVVHIDQLRAAVKID